MTDNFKAVSEAHDMTHQELAQLTINAIDASFIDESTKREYRSRVADYVARFS